MVVVKKTDVTSKGNIRKCLVGVTNFDSWLESVRPLTVTLPEYKIIDINGRWYDAPIALIDRKLTKHERLAHVSTPAVSFLISQIEQVISRVKEADKVEALINWPPDEFTKKGQTQHSCIAPEWWEKKRTYFWSKNVSM
jgi:hypothetical protein